MRFCLNLSAQELDKLLADHLSKQVGNRPVKIESVYSSEIKADENGQQHLGISVNATVVE